MTTLPDIAVTHCITCGAEHTPWRDLIDLNCESCADAKKRIPYRISSQRIENGAGLLRDVIVRESI